MTTPQPHPLTPPPSPHRAHLYLPLAHEAEPSLAQDLVLTNVERGVAVLIGDIAGQVPEDLRGRIKTLS